MDDEAQFTATARVSHANFLMFSIPDDPKLIEQVGRVAIRHAFLDHQLKMTIKMLTRATPPETLRAIGRRGSFWLRGKVEEEARQKFGEGDTLASVVVLLKRCEKLTERRNEILHSIWARFHGGDGQLFDGEEVLPLPTLEELERLEKDIRDLANEINDARLFGVIAEGMRRDQAAPAADPR